MRSELVTAMTALMERSARTVFLTGDLGFRALEPIRERFGKRFVNVGVAEQNLIAIAAGLAVQGFSPWTYSIAPFAVLRPFEQIRNDVCLHGLPVKMIGNGGGYAYGINGATHHALEDFGVMRTLPGMRVYVPSFSTDVAEAVDRMASEPGPGYLRLGLGAKLDAPPPPLAPFRPLVEGAAATVVALGPIVGEALAAARGDFAGQLDVWSVSAWPLGELPAALLASIARTQTLVTLEEHYRSGGMGEALATAVLETLGALGKLSGRLRFHSLAAQGYPSGRYGSQAWHLRENGLGGEPFTRRLREILANGR